MKKVLCKLYSVYFLLFSLIMVTDILHAQITDVEYMIKYNDTTQRYDCFIVVKGNTSSAIHRAQFNAQYTVVVPTGVEVSVSNYYMPLINNMNYMGTTPTEWNAYNLNHPTAQPQHDFYAFGPNLSPTAFYNNLSNNDTVKIFSLQISPLPQCKNEVRLYENGVDPDSGAAGMNGADMWNGFTIGEPAQKYRGNINLTPYVPPVVSISGTNTICTYNTTILHPSTGGTWQSLNPTIASVDNNGIVMGVSSGNTRFIYRTYDTGCPSLLTDTIKVLSNTPVTLVGPSSVCPGNTSQVEPSSGGSWSSTNTNIASISHTGDIIGVSPGLVDFIYMPNEGGCASRISGFQVYTLPLLTYPEPFFACLGNTLHVTPISGGAWSSNNNNVANISNLGLITTIGQGSATFTYTNTLSGCSATTPPLIVNPIPTVTISSQTVEVNKSVNLTPTSGGTWFSNQTDVITIVDNQFAKGIKVGSGSVFFTVASTGCTSTSTSINVIDAKSTIVGYAFRDINGNNIFDANTDTPLPNCAINIPGLSSTYYTDKTGYYNIKVDPGTYSANFTIPYGNWTTNTKTRTINATNAIAYVFVGFTPVIQTPNATINVRAEGLKCNNSVSLTASVLNNTSQVFSGYISLQIDTNSNVSSTDPIPAGSDNNLLIWTVNNLLPGHTFSPEILIDVPFPSTMLDSLFYEATLSNLNSEELSKFTYKDEISCSITSGKFLSWPDRGSPEKFTYPNETLKYMIRFRNPHASVVNKVIVTNVVDNNIDLSSILIHDASHPLKSYRINNTLYFEFDDINLAQGRNNSPEGYITFECKPLLGLPDMTVISNTAMIQFDENPVIPSNQTINTITSGGLGPLPITWIGFEANNEVDHVMLSWEVAGEKSGSTYDILWSRDGSVFSKIAQLVGNSSGERTNTYNYQHQNTALGSHFYKILQIDADGLSTLSQIRKVEIAQKNVLSLLLIKPTVVHDILIMELTKENLHRYDINIYNMSGVLVYTMSGNNISSQSIDVSHLPRGLYTVHVKTSDTIKTAKFLKY